ncbi:hypothetical protein [Streptomyces sennicomposti]
MTGTPEQNGLSLTFTEAERGLGYPIGTLRKAADEAGWTELQTLDSWSLCDVLCLVWPYPDPDNHPAPEE